jgi:hypothetical protein
MFMLVLRGLKVEEAAGHTGLEPVISALAWKELAHIEREALDRLARKAP